QHIDDRLDRMPVWIADTETNRAAVERFRALRGDASQNTSPTAAGSVTTFTVDLTATPEAWCLNGLDVVAGHHDRYSQSRGWSALEVYGAAPSPTLLKALANYRLTRVTPFSGVSRKHS